MLITLPTTQYSYLPILMLKISSVTIDYSRIDTSSSSLWVRGEVGYQLHPTRGEVPYVGPVPT